MLPVRDSSTDQVFHDQAEHIPIEEPSVTDQAKGATIAVAELIDSSSEGTETEEPETEEPAAEMVVRRKLMADLFLHGGQSAP